MRPLSNYSVRKYQEALQFMQNCHPDQKKQDIFNRGLSTYVYFRPEYKLYTTMRQV